MGQTIITCLARMGGRPVGIVANQPKHLGGILDNDSADKAARFVRALKLAQGKRVERP